MDFRLASPKLFFLWCFIFSVFTISVNAQQYNFQHYSVRNGLPHSQIKCIYQDKSGFVWVGTQAGASRFDGKEFENFGADNGLPGHVVTAITETREGILLATDSGVVVFQTGKFYLNRITGPERFSTVYAFLDGFAGDILLATDRGIFSYANGKYKHINTSTPIDDLPVRVGYRDSKDNLWVGTERNGLFKLQFSKGVYTNVSFTDQDKLVNAAVRGITELEGGQVLIATSGDGLFQYDGTVMNKLTLPGKTATEYFTCLHKDVFGDVWLGTWGNGTIHYSHGVFKQYTKSNGLGDEIVICSASDRQGNNWFGTFSDGLVFFYGNQFTSLTVTDGMPDNNVHGITQDDDGNMWFATLGGIAMYDGLDVRTFTDEDGVPKLGYGAIVSDGKRIFAGSVTGEIVVIDNGKGTVYKSSSENNPGEIISMAYTPDGSVWVGTVQKGLFHFQNGKTESVNTGNQLQYNPIWSIHVSADGRIWLGTSKGLFVMENGNAVRPPEIKSKRAPVEPVYSIQSDANYIYFATEHDGIFRYSPKAQVYNFLNKKQGGIGSDFTKGVLYVNESTMYITNMLGMDRISFQSDTQQVRHFWYNEGIGTDNFYFGAIFYSKDNRVWLGSSDGVIIYQPASERQRLAPPNADIKEVLLFNQQTDWSKYADTILANGLPFEPELAYDQNQLTFHLSAIQFGAGVNIRYMYQLEGLEKKWNFLSDGNSVSYSNLPPGDYRFLVRAGNSNGVWSEPYAFRFTISHPFWSSWWFFIIVLLVLSFVAVSLTFLYRRFRTDFIRRHRSFGDYQLSTSRMVLLFIGIFYPVSLFMCQFFTPGLNIHPVFILILGTVLTFTGIATYFSQFVRNYASFASQIAFGIVIMHSLYMNYANNLNPVTVAILAVALGGGGIVFDNIRATTIFSAAIVLASAILMYLSGSDTQYNRWLLLLAVVISVVIMYVNVFSRLNLFNRLIFADTTINNSRSIVIAADEQGKIIFASRSIRSLLGYSEEEVLGDGWWKIRTDDQSENEQMRQQVKDAKGTIPVYVAPVKAKNGTTRWIQWSDTEIEGGIKVGIGLDVTDRHEIEERYRHIVESATDIIYTADFRGNFNYVNEVGTKLSGYRMEELMGRHFTSLVHPDWSAEVQEFYKKQFSRRTLSSYLEFPIVTKSGEMVWLGQTVRTLFDEKRSSFVAGFQAIARDITEKKRYEEELEQLSLVASETLNGVLICNPKGTIEWVNDGFTRITGYSLADVKDRLPGDVLAGDRTDMTAISQVREQSSKAEGFHKEFLVYHKDGHEIWIAVTNTPIVDEHDRVLKQIEIFNDITEKKRYEIQLNRYSARLETLNMAKQELLRSHTVEAVAQNVLGSLASRINYLKRASIALFDEYTGLAEFLYVLRDGNHALGRNTFTMDSFRSIPTLRKNQHLHVSDLTLVKEISESDQENLDAGIRSYLVTPLYSQGQLIGSVNIGSAIPGAITEDDIEMVREVADAMAGILLQLRYRDIIDQKNADISASIQYARRIQEAILPPEEMLREQIGDLFVFHKSKDMLSGDFYWAEKHNGYTFLAVADSTGHGVPGALLSMMGQNLLNQAVHERNLVRPAAILDYLNAGIQHTLNQYKKAGELRDGMDISLCVFQEGTNMMYFAGAINPMYIIRDGMLIQSKGNRFSIGSYFDNRMRPFTNQETELFPGDVVYIFSDGYPDQFGGEDDRKLSQRRFRELLMNIHKEDMQRQKELLGEYLVTWMNDNIQTDDICVVGYRIR